MVPASFQAFFTASATAAAALIGLLFVAVSVRPEAVFGEKAEAQNTLVASASFTALLNAFFISLGALIPGANLGVFVVVFSPVALLNSVVLGIDAFRPSARPAALRSLTLVIVALGLYGYELVNAIVALRAPRDISPVYNIMGVLLGVYMYGVARAWQLLSGNRRGVVTLIVPWLRHNPATPKGAESASGGALPAAPAPAPSVPVTTIPASVPEDVAPRQGG